jgi:hypothetical protein
LNWKPESNNFEPIVAHALAWERQLMTRQPLGRR